jgi:hypothetical protein
MHLLKYTHPAATKWEVNKVYNLEELKSELSDEMIKVLFEPVNFQWQDLEVKNTKNIKIEEKD